MTQLRFLFLQWLKRDIQGRYRGSWLGLLWPVLQPLAQLLIFTTVFYGFMQLRWPAGDFASGAQAIAEDRQAWHYGLNVLAGLAVFNFFAEILNRAPSLIYSQPFLVTKLRFPLAVLPWVCVASALIHIVVASVVIILAQGLQGHWNLAFWLLPVWLLPILLYGVALALALSTVGVYLRDLAQAMPAVTSVLMFITPIFYPIQMVPASMRTAFEFNPLAWGTESLRTFLIAGGTFDASLWLVHMLTSAAGLAIASLLFIKLRDGFADVL